MRGVLAGRILRKVSIQSRKSVIDPSHRAIGGGYAEECILPDLWILGGIQKTLPDQNGLPLLLEFVVGLGLAETNGQLGIRKLLELLKNRLELFLILLQTGIGGIHLHEGLRVFLKASRVVGDHLVDLLNTLFLKIHDNLLGPHDRVHPQRLLSLPLAQQTITDPDGENVELERVINQVARTLKLIQ